jgi:hypothetical protein
MSLQELNSVLPLTSLKVPDRRWGRHVLRRASWVPILAHDAPAPVVLELMSLVYCD